MTNPSDLIDDARNALEASHSPYSGYAVGAALATDAGVFLGTNIENVNYSNTIHAEEAALVQARLNGAEEYHALALITPGDPLPPCGRCRQTLYELCPPDMPIYTPNDDGEVVEWTLEEILPGAMNPDDVLSETE